MCSFLRLIICILLYPMILLEFSLEWSAHMIVWSLHRRLSITYTIDFLVRFDSLVFWWVDIRFASEWVPETLGSNPRPTRGRQLVSSMMTSSNGNFFCVICPLCGEFTGHRWISLTKGQWCGIWCFFGVSPHKLLDSLMPGDLRLHDIYMTSS